MAGASVSSSSSCLFRTGKREKESSSQWISLWCYHHAVPSIRIPAYCSPTSSFFSFPSWINHNNNKKKQSTSFSKNFVVVLVFYCLFFCLPQSTEHEKCLRPDTYTHTHWRQETPVNFGQTIEEKKKNQTRNIRWEIDKMDERGGRWPLGVPVACNAGSSALTDPHEKTRSRRPIEKIPI